MNLSEIGQSIKERRKFLGKTQSDLSDIVGIGLRSLVDIEAGKGNPTIKQLTKILNALGLTLTITIPNNDR